VKASVAASRNRSAPSKQDAVLALLQRPKGATLSEITEATVGSRTRCAASCPASSRRSSNSRSSRGRTAVIGPITS
jgi:hypothetical protein